MLKMLHFQKAIARPITTVNENNTSYEHINLFQFQFELLKQQNEPQKNVANNLSKNHSTTYNAQYSSMFVSSFRF